MVVVVEVLLETANTVPTSWANVGLDEELKVALRHAGEPDGPVTGDTACQALPVHHSSPLPAPMLQSSITSWVKVLPGETDTSKYDPVEVNVGEPTGSELYWATVTPPVPVALAVTPPSVAEGLDPDALW